MKKLVSGLLALISVIAFAFAGCGGSSIDWQEIEKIETSIYFGEVLIYYDPVRTFDFSAGTVTDTVTMTDEQIERMLFMYNDDPERYAEFRGYETAEEYEAHLRTYYNSTEQIASFTQEKAEAFLKRIVKLGIGDWRERYEDRNITCGNWYTITITFKDGTQKSTSCYYARPDNYDKIENAFNEYLGTGIFCMK